MPKHLLTAAEVSEILQVKTPSVYSLARENRLPGVVRIGRLIRFDEDAIQQYIADGGQTLPGGWKREA